MRSKRVVLILFNVGAKHGHDLFSFLGEEKRPDYCWIIAGPKRSGSSFHIDPNGTHAWNAPILGRKRTLDILSPRHIPNPVSYRPPTAMMSPCQSPSENDSSPTGTITSVDGRRPIRPNDRWRVRSHRGIFCSCRMGGGIVC